MPKGGTVVDSETNDLGSMLSLLKDVERHWTTQVQDQQQRNGAILTVNGFLLPFLATGLFVVPKLHDHWYFYAFWISLLLLSAALFCGVIALWSSVPISGASSARGIRAILIDTPGDPDPWLDSSAIWSQFEANQFRFVPAQLTSLCESVAGNARSNRALMETLALRRVWMRREIFILSLALIAIIVAILGWGFSPA
jgi:hypothetical protein